jgi:hypothetical protein
MSQRTRRPYLSWVLEMGGYAGRMRKGRGRKAGASAAGDGGMRPFVARQAAGDDGEGKRGMRDRGRRCRRRSGEKGRRALEDIPFELVGKVAGAGAVAKASDVERSSAARHFSGVAFSGG